jgi:hypothetical protein
VDDIEPGFELPLPGDKVKPEILELCMEFLKMYKEEPMTVIPKVSLGAQRRDSSGRCDMSYVTMCSSFLVSQLASRLCYTGAGACPLFGSSPGEFGSHLVNRQISVLCALCSPTTR